MENNKTAVEWLFRQLWEEPKDKFTWYAILKQAKEMEKQQKIEFARHCLEKANSTFDLDILTSFIDVHQYYNEEYGKDTTDNTTL